MTLSVALIALALALAPLVTAEAAYSLSIPNAKFNSESHTHYALDKNYTVPWEASIEISNIGWNTTTGTRKAAFELSMAGANPDAQQHQFFIHAYDGTKVLDTSYTNDGGTSWIETAKQKPWAYRSDGPEFKLLVEKTGFTLYVWNGTSKNYYKAIDSFKTDGWTIDRVGAFGATWSTTGGYATVTVDVASATTNLTGMTDTIMAIVPVIVLVAVLGGLIGMFKKTKL